MSVRGLSDGPVHHVPIHRMAIDVGWVIVTASLAGAACGDARGGGGAEVDGAGGSGGAEVSAVGGTAGSGGAGSVGPDFGCVGKPAEPPVASESEAEVTLRFSYFESLDQVHVLSGATVEACLRDDPTCETPIATAEESPSLGLYTLTVPISETGFDGSFHVTSPATVPFARFAESPLVGDFVDDYEVIDSPASLAELLTAADLTLDPGRGLAFIFVLDCKGGSARGATVSLEGGDELTTVHYMDASGLYVDPSAPALGDFGLALAMNVPASPVRARVTTPTGEVFESRPFQPIEQGEVYVWVAPTTVLRD